MSLKVYFEHCAIIILQYILSLHPHLSGTSGSGHLRPDAGVLVEIYDVVKEKPSLLFRSGWSLFHGDSFLFSCRFRVTLLRVQFLVCTIPQRKTESICSEHSSSGFAARSFLIRERPFLWLIFLTLVSLVLSVDF